LVKHIKKEINHYHLTSAGTINLSSALSSISDRCYVEYIPNKLNILIIAISYTLANGTFPLFGAIFG